MGEQRAKVKWLMKLFINIYNMLSSIMRAYAESNAEFMLIIPNRNGWNNYRTLLLSVEREENE